MKKKIWILTSTPLFLTTLISCQNKEINKNEDKNFYIIDDIKYKNSKNSSVEIELKLNSNISTTKENIQIYYKNSDNQEILVNNSFIKEIPLEKNLLVFEINNLTANYEYFIYKIIINNQEVNFNNFSTKFQLEIANIEINNSSVLNQREEVSNINFILNNTEYLEESNPITIVELIDEEQNTYLFEDILQNNILNINLNKILSSSSKTLKVSKINFKDLKNKIIISNEILNTKFTTKKISNEIENKEDNFVIDFINFKNITENSFLVIFHFSEFNLSNENLKTFKLVLKSKNSDEEEKEIIVSNYEVNSPFIEINVNELKSNTQYYIDSFSLNNKNLTIEKLVKEVTTAKTTIKNFSSSELIFDESKNLYSIKLSYDKNQFYIPNNAVFSVFLSPTSEENNLIELTNEEISSDNSFVFFNIKNQIKKGVEYNLIKILYESKEISFPPLSILIKDKLFSFPKPDILENKTLTQSGNINNPKIIFDKNIFPNSVLLEKTDNNLNLVKNYFNIEMTKILKYIQGTFKFSDEFPKWTNFSDFNNPIPAEKLLSKIPDLQARFKEENNIYKYVNKLMPIFIQYQEIKLSGNKKEATLKLNLKNFLNKPFTDKKIGITFDFRKKDDSFETKISQRILINLEELLNNKNVLNNEWVTEFFEEPFVKFNYNIDNDSNLIIKIKPNDEYSDYIPDFSFTQDETKIENNIFISKYNTLVDVSYLTKDEEDENFSLVPETYQSDLHAKLSSNGQYYSNKINNPLKFSNGKRILEQETDTNFQEIRKRVFVVGGGTSTMLAKVKPNDPNDYRYFFITNRHVSDILETRWYDSRVLKKFLIPDFNDSKVNSANSEISINVEKKWFNFNFWQAINQTKRDETKEQDSNRNNADISISIIDIEPILKQAKLEKNTKIINYLNEWQRLKPLKLSKKTNYISQNNYVKFFVSSFPQDPHLNFSGRRYREHIINRIEKVTINDQAQEFAKYGYFKTFIQYDNNNNNDKYDLISGASGSIVYDESGEMVAIFMQNTGDDGYGFGFLSSLEFDYFGFETSSNPNSFKNKLLKSIELEPSKFEMIEI
ncbi:hypothetical protein [Mycoplasma sp. 5370]